MALKIEITEHSVAEYVGEFNPEFDQHRLYTGKFIKFSTGSVLFKRHNGKCYLCGAKCWNFDFYA